MALDIQFPNRIAQCAKTTSTRNQTHATLPTWFPFLNTGQLLFEQLETSFDKRF